MLSVDCILLRLSGEICTKSRRTRHRFTTQLVEAVEDALTSNDLRYRLRRRWSRVFVEAPPAAADIVARVWGVQSVSPAERHAWQSLDDLVATGRRVFAPAVEGRRFAVRARRTGGDVPREVSASAVERQLGTALLPAAAGVDLDHPEVTTHVEVHASDAYFFTEIRPGPGGLPMGVEGRALCLISGGFDSAVAAWLTLKRGVALDYVLFNLGGAAHERSVVEVLEILARRWSYGDWPRLHLVDLRPLVPIIRDTIHPRLWQLALKVAMYRCAELLARQTAHPALVTGEAIGQVSSQTLPNLAALDRLVSIPVLRPLLGFNKDEIVARARAIGTYQASAAVDEYCALQPRHTATAVSEETLRGATERLTQAVFAPLVADRRTMDLRTGLADDALDPSLEVEAIPEGATVLDLRPPDEYRDWHVAGALSLEFFEALRSYPSFDRTKTYVLYCEVGLKSAHLAELMRRAGFAAYHVGRGVRGLSRLREELPEAVS